MTVRVPAVAVAVLLAAGCGPTSYPVTGVVVLADGSPAPALAGSEILMTSPQLSARGEVGPDGRFDMYSERPGDGVPPGDYKVTLTLPPRVNSRGKDGKVKGPSVDPAVFRTATTPLSVTVGPDVKDVKLVLPPAPAGAKARVTAEEEGP